MMNVSVFLYYLRFVGQSEECDAAHAYDDLTDINQRKMLRRFVFFF